MVAKLIDIDTDEIIARLHMTEAERTRANRHLPDTLAWLDARWFSVAEVIAQENRRMDSIAEKSQGDWIPACNGTEVPFMSRSGRKLLYCYQASTGDHAYIDCGTDMLLSDAEAWQALGNT